jgi:hypothetical protein
MFATIVAMTASNDEPVGKAEGFTAGTTTEG